MHYLVLIWIKHCKAIGPAKKAITVNLYFRTKHQQLILMVARLFSRWLDTSNQECKSVRYSILAINRDEDTEEDSVLIIIDWTHLFTVFSLLCGSSGIC
jgi:hypothetical protein